LTEDIEEYHFDFFDTAMTILESQSRAAITIKINSYGGDVHTALAIIGRMQESRCHIHTKGYGKIMSASTAILAAGRKRSISRLSEFMHHEMSYEVGGKHSEILHNVKQAQTLSDRWCTLMFELTGTPIEYWSEMGKGNDHYLTPEICLELNVVDRIF
jgi:ATP-dependent protease ClpP protease subunit